MDAHNKQIEKKDLLLSPSIIEENEQYVNLILDVIKKNKNVSISNSSISHAKIGMSALFCMCNKNAYLITDKFSESFWNDMIRPLNAFLNKADSHMKIILRNGKAKQNNTLLWFCEYFKEKIEIFELDDTKLKKANIDRNEISDFLLVDDFGYRMETSSPDFTIKKVTGQLNFSDKEYTKECQTFFSNIAENLGVIQNI